MSVFNFYHIGSIQSIGNNFRQGSRKHSAEDCSAQMSVVGSEMISHGAHRITSEIAIPASVKFKSIEIQ